MQNRLLPPAAIVYGWQQLLNRAGENAATLPLTLHYHDRIHSNPFSPTIAVESCGVTAWRDLLNAKPNSLIRLPVVSVCPPEIASPFNGDLPILLWGTGADKTSPPVEKKGEYLIIFHFDIIAATVFMLSRWEETVVPDRDEHGRFPVTASVAHKQGFLDRPIVDEYALILREWLKVLLPEWDPAPQKFSIKISHDIDQIRHQPNAYWALRTFAGDLLKRRDPVQALRTATDAVSEALAPRRAVFYQNIFQLMKLSKENGLKNTAFYLMTADPQPPDNDYDLASPLMLEVLDALVDDDFEIGFHAGYHTLHNPDQLTKEQKRLTALLGIEGFGGRQHYLRFQAPDTWRHWEQAGLTYDSTLGYADHEGFRCGTCHPFRPFDIEQNRELDLWEIPLIVMDGTLRQYRGLTPEDSEDRIRALARRCKQVEGIFTLLWHNSSLGRDWRTWGEMYHRVLSELSSWGKEDHVVDESTV